MTSVSVSVLNSWPSACSCCFERQVVFDDAVVHHHDFALAVAVRVRVLLGGTAVGGPARVADPEGAVDGIQPDGVLQVPQLALGAPDLQLVIAAVNRQARRVVSAILQPLQALQNDRDGALCPDVAHDSAHRFYYRWQSRGRPV